MVRAILDGRKTQTRRVVKPQPEHAQLYQWKGRTLYDGEARRWCWKNHVTLDSWAEPTKALSHLCPYGLPGDRLWVRETWANHADEPCEEGSKIFYLADGDDRRGNPHINRWRPSIHMPHWASRITLEITGVRVERLNEISEMDAIAEGIGRQAGDGTGPGPGYKWNGIGYHGAGFTEHGEPTFHVPDDMGLCKCNVGWKTPAQCAFRELWNCIHGPDAWWWSSNPWVWVIEFRRIEP